jgi:spore coat polysaccharide biosynthesis protein SpsF (cytidylyltransferase family)
MFETIGIVDVSGSSTDTLTRDRWQWLAKRRLAGQPLLAWAIRRLSEAQRLDLVVAIVPGGDSSLAALIPSGIAVCSCDEPDALSRLAATVRRFPTEAFVRTQMNCPLVDPVLIDGVIRVASNDNDCDYVGYCSNDGRPSALSEVGVFGEWCRAAAIERADEVCRENSHRQHGTSYLYANVKEYRVRFLPAPAALDRTDVRLALADCADLEYVEDILEALGPDRLDWQQIVDLLDDHPALLRGMETRNRAAARL